MKPRVYIETTIPSYLTAWPSRDLVRADHQKATREWWLNREAFDLFTSRSVVRECQAGDPEAAARRLEALADLPILDDTPESAALSDSLIQGARLPARASVDAIHIAVAAVHDMDYLLTWNCTHIANVIYRPIIEVICK